MKFIIDASRMLLIFILLRAALIITYGHNPHWSVWCVIAMIVGLAFAEVKP